MATKTDKKRSSESSTSQFRETASDRWVRQQLEGMDRAAKRAQESPQSAIAFLQRAGILDSKGNLKKQCR